MDVPVSLAPSLFRLQSVIRQLVGGKVEEKVVESGEKGVSQANDYGPGLCWGM